MEKFNDIQQIKRHIYALRNGVIADTLQKAGLGYKYIFGLNLPQIAEIAAETGVSEEIAMRLRDDRLCRESRLLAPMIYPVDKLTVESALEWMNDSDTTEIVDILCHRLLKKMPAAWEVVKAASESQRDLTRYGALRLAFNLISNHIQESKLLAERELARDCRLTAPLARQIIEEVDFLTDENN